MRPGHRGNLRGLAPGDGADGRAGRGGADPAGVRRRRARAPDPHARPARGRPAPRRGLAEAPQRLAAEPGRQRRADGPCQPPPVRRPPRARVRARAPQRGAVRPHPGRRRPLQEVQRPLRPPGRRRLPAQGRRRHRVRRAPAGRPGRALRRGGVRRHPGRYRPGGRQRGGRDDPRGCGGPGAAPSGQPVRPRHAQHGPVRGSSGAGRAQRSAGVGRGGGPAAVYTGDEPVGDYPRHGSERHIHQARQADAGARRAAVFCAVLDRPGDEQGVPQAAAQAGPDLPAISRHARVVGKGRADGVRDRRPAVPRLRHPDAAAEAPGSGRAGHPHPVHGRRAAGRRGAESRRPRAGAGSGRHLRRRAVRHRMRTGGARCHQEPVGHVAWEVG
ncbi:hypothetical protein Lal_00014938 [Lupinus albus]|nr:hypothetical protein Lal_00014938 [Lupinus albus]